jgi:hypothetical protein
MTMWLLRRLPAETAHNLAIWSLKTGAWRIGVVVDALITLSWSWPLKRLMIRARAPDN